MDSPKELNEKLALQLYKTFGNYPCDTAEQWWADMADNEKDWWKETASNFQTLLESDYSRIVAALVAERKKILDLAIKSDILCPKNKAYENGCMACKNFWEAFDAIQKYSNSRK